MAQQPGPCASRAVPGWAGWHPRFGAHGGAASGTRARPAAQPSGTRSVQYPISDPLGHPVLPRADEM